MIICTEFDGVIVSDEHRFDDVSSNFQLLKGAQEGLLSLKRAGHELVLYSVRAGLRHDGPLHEARFQAMLSFVQRKLPGVFDKISDGSSGKPVADLYLDARTPYGMMPWSQIRAHYGE